MKNKKFIEALDDISVSTDLKNRTYENIINHKNKPSLLPKFILALSLILAVGSSISFYQMYNKVTSIISIDINPSLEIYINRFDRVVDIKAFNDDGIKLSNELDIINNNYNDALEKISLNTKIEALINNGEQLAITVALLDDKNDSLVDDTITFTNHHKNMHFNEIEHDEVSNAHHNNLSCGKYKLYLELKELDDKITAEDIESLSTREIMDMMEELGYNFDNQHQGKHHNHHK